MVSNADGCYECRAALRAKPLDGRRGNCRLRITKLFSPFIRVMSRIVVTAKDAHSPKGQSKMATYLVVLRVRVSGHLVKIRFGLWQTQFQLDRPARSSLQGF